MRKPAYTAIGNLSRTSAEPRCQPPAPVPSVDTNHRVALEIRFNCDVMVEAANDGSPRFAVTRRELTHSFPTLDQLEAFLTPDPAKRDEVNRGFEGRCAFYESEAKRFQAMGDTTIANILLKVFAPPVVKPNALALIRAKIEKAST